MKVYNIHQRIIHQPKSKIVPLLSTLATKEDKIWPCEQWPRMKFDRGLKLGAIGGHGPIGYSVKQIVPGEFVQFLFSRPKGFHGVHQFTIEELGPNETKLSHVIDMRVSGLAILTWPLGIRWLHDALTEDAMDKVENYFSEKKKRTPWSLWVRLLRMLLG